MMRKSNFISTKKEVMKENYKTEIRFTMVSEPATKRRK
jgi:hypothetical protein